MSELDRPEAARSAPPRDDAQLSLFGEPSVRSIAFRLMRLPDGRRRYLDIGLEIEALAGLRPDDVLADADVLRRLIPAVDRARLQQEEDLSADALSILSTEVPLIAAGTTRWVRFTAVPERKPDGSVVWEGFQDDTTDRRRTEKALRLAQEAGGIGVFERDFVARTTWWSPELFRLYGYDPEGRHPILDFDIVFHHIHPDDKAPHDARRQAFLAGRERRFSFQFRILRADGQMRWIASRGEVERDADGTPLRVSGVNIDITELKQAEEQVRSREAELQRVQRIARTGGYEVSLTAGLKARRSPEYNALHGLPAELEEETHAAWLERLHPDDRERAEQTLFAALDGTVSEYRSEYRIIRPDDGAVRWIAALAEVERDETGKPLRLIGSHTDITERKLIEQELRRRSAEMTALLHSAPVGIAFFDREHRYQQINDELAEINGLAPEAHLGESIEDLLPVNARLVGPILDRVFETGEVVRDLEIAGETPKFPGVERHWLTSFYPVRDPQGAVVAVGSWVVEITDRKRAEAEMLKLNAELEARVAERTASLLEANRRLSAEMEQREAAQAALVQSQKLEAIGQLTAGIAHDFNNVIAAIAGGFSVIERRSSDLRILEVARHGVNAAQRGASLVRQLLAFARQQTLEPRTVRLRELLDEALPLLGRSAGATVSVNIVCPDGLHARVDPVQLEAALINLAGNARDAMPEGGRLTISGTECPVGAPGRPAELGSTPAVMLAITDNGMGIPEAVLARVVDPFFTTKGPGLGTGLGLAMVHGFAHQSGGTMRIESRVGSGTTVTLYLPAAEAPLEAEADRMAPADPELEEPGYGTVLLVDDDHAVRGVVAAQLGDFGFDVVEARDAYSAIALLRGDTPIDLILSDIGMPGLDGRGFAVEARHIRPLAPVLFMTGNADHRGAPGEVVLRKPFSINDLRRAIQRLLESRAPGQNGADTRSGESAQTERALPPVTPLSPG